jgi:putative phosphoribosyl transferase
MRFLNRVDAGRQLAKRLRSYAKQKNVIVLGIPRGGVPVAYEVASELEAPLDVFVVRKLGVPWQPELAFGAIASGGVCILDDEVVESAGISHLEVERVAAREEIELQRREKIYRGGRPALALEGKAVILVDDGIATGASTRAAITALRQLHPCRIVLAAPVAPGPTYRRLRSEVDDFVCVHTPETFYAIGEFYDDFSQVSDEEVMELLRPVNKHRAHTTAETDCDVAKEVHS